jgi:hypothetical protein
MPLIHDYGLVPGLPNQACFFISPISVPQFFPLQREGRGEDPSPVAFDDVGYRKTFVQQVPDHASSVAYERFAVGPFHTPPIPLEFRDPAIEQPDLPFLGPSDSQLHPDALNEALKGGIGWGRRHKGQRLGLEHDSKGLLFGFEGNDLQL